MTSGQVRALVLAGDDAVGTVDRSVQRRDEQEVLLAQDLVTGQPANLGDRGLVAVDDRVVLAVDLVVLLDPLFERAGLVAGFPVTDIRFGMRPVDVDEAVTESLVRVEPLEFAFPGNTEGAVVVDRDDVEIPRNIPERAGVTHGSC